MILVVIGGVVLGPFKSWMLLIVILLTWFAIFYFGLKKRS